MLIQDLIFAILFALAAFGMVTALSLKNEKLALRLLLCFLLMGTAVAMTYAYFEWRQAHKINLELKQLDKDIAEMLRSMENISERE